MITLVKKTGTTRQGVFIDDKAVLVTYDDGSTLCVPTDPNNRHYAEVLAWVAKGNTIEAAD